MQTLVRSNFNIPHRPVKILQFGNGNFLRGFTDWMVEKANGSGVFNGNIHVVQVHSKSGNDAMKDQGNLFHIIERGLKNGKLIQEYQLVTCIDGVSSVFENYQDYLKLGENPDLRFIVSNTTEAGIVFDPNDTDMEVIPKTFPGKLTALLFHRFQTFKGDESKGLIFLPCELIEQNGDTLKNCIDKYATLWKLPMDFMEWIETACTFCNTLVDRIVPGFPKDSIDEIQETLGYEDKLAVMVEPYHFWAIEKGDAIRKEFALDQAGLNVKYVDDLSRFRTQKVRILNGGHTAMVTFAYLKGIRTVREAVENPEINSFLRKAIFEEIIPTLEIPEEEVIAFANDVLERFANPFIVHELKSIALNCVSKFKVRVLPSLLSYHRIKRIWPQNLITSFAALLIFYRGEYDGKTTPVNDEPAVIKQFQKAWELTSTQEIVHTLLKDAAFWGEDLTKYEGLESAISTAVDKLLRA